MNVGQTIFLCVIFRLLFDSEFSRHIPFLPRSGKSDFLDDSVSPDTMHFPAICCLDLLAHPTSKTQNIAVNNIVMTFTLVQI